jgi:hypothetical protein
MLRHCYDVSTDPLETAQRCFRSSVPPCSALAYFAWIVAVSDSLTV